MIGQFAICVLAAVVLATVGCGRKASEKTAEKMIENAIEKSGGGNAQVDIADGSVRIRTPDGDFASRSGENVPVPADFPKDMPVYAGAKVQTTMKTGHAHMLSLVTADPIEKVAQSYESQMTQGGWKEEARMSANETTSLTYSKNDGKRNAQIVVSGSDKETRIVLSVEEDKPATK